MGGFHDVELEIVRPGPPHNQLLSPLTQYLALCGAGSPTTFHIELEHRQLLNRLDRLRYYTDGPRPEAVPDRLRQAEIAELGRDIGTILSSIPSLNAELSKATGRAYQARSGDADDYVHLRMVLSGSELAIVPFELAMAPQSYPGEGLEFLLQGSVPIVLTREIRRSRPLPKRLDELDKVKVLFAYAEPEGRTVPHGAHLRALIEAVRPWARRPVTAEDHTDAALAGQLKEHLRVLPDASLDALYRLCAKESFTHVHLLAHGDHLDVAGEQRFGIALAKPGDPAAKEVVSGERLAKALRAEREDGTGRSQPFLVTLTSCDSGAGGSVLVPGGSIAHDLHTHGIPWVIASQFPLRKSGSVRLVRELYPRLLRGDDPRQALYELRRKMYASASEDHDWASVVTYAAVPDDFGDQVAGFLFRRAEALVNVELDYLDNLAQQPATDRTAVLEEVAGRVMAVLDRWERRLPAQDGAMTARVARTNCCGIKGSALKRLALHWRLSGCDDRAEQVMHQSLDAYQRAMDEWALDYGRFTWTATQYLSVCAVLGKSIDEAMLTVCRRKAERELADADPQQRAWAHGTLAELELLAVWQAHTAADPDAIEQATERVTGHCAQIVSLCGASSFAVRSTARQFQRYAENWQGMRAVPEHCAEVVAAAVANLSRATAAPTDLS